MYHVVSDPFPDSPYPDLYVPRAEFQEQMQALKDAGYTAVTLQEAWDSWHEDGPLPAKPVVVSFDDGYHSHLANALPVLRALGWPGVLNLELQNIRSDYGLTGPQVRELIAAGWELDSHTIDHPDLTTVDAATLQREVADSRAQLKRRFGVPVNFFCYPAGRYDDAAIAAVQAAGYLAATTTEPGLAEPDEADRFTLHRVRVNNGVSGATLVAQLAAYD
jgi:peptidoglycan/xylan/chitin deacetylase (PgdA/CDA1 family)